MKDHLRSFPDQRQDLNLLHLKAWKTSCKNRFAGSPRQIVIMALYVSLVKSNSIFDSGLIYYSFTASNMPLLSTMIVASLNPLEMATLFAFCASCKFLNPPIIIRVISPFL